MTNPIIANVLRGGFVESRHRGAFAISDAKGGILAQLGYIESPVYPRSAIKAFQCLPLIESGAADHFGLSDDEICLCCSSHNGEEEHVRVARSILGKAGVDEVCLECGAHWPSCREAAYALVREGKPALQVHNNCSGKHSGMLALARHLKIEPKGYVAADHAVQKGVAAALSRYCEVDLTRAPMGIDGCSVPTWAMPLRNLAKGFAKLSGDAAGQWIGRAVRANPFLVAGTARFDTRIMEAVPRLFIKVGAEGVFCGFIAHAGLGFALKCDDGGTRGSEVAIAAALAKLDVWSADEREVLQAFTVERQKNWRRIEVGEVRAENPAT
jgi:L-asparaginase II